MIIDTSAMVAIFRDEPNAATLTRALLDDPEPQMSAATLVELYAVADSRNSPAQRRRLDAIIKAFGISVVPFTADQAMLAREAYRDYGRGSGHPAKLNLGDVFSYALAASTGKPLLYVGKDFAETDLGSCS